MLYQNNRVAQQYIVRLIGKVVTVSVETVKLVEQLAQSITRENWMGNEVITS